MRQTALADHISIFHHQLSGTAWKQLDQDEALISPLMRHRIFSDSNNFVRFDFFVGNAVNENVFAYSDSAGSERGVIIYNNKSERTAGWIHTSVAHVETADSRDAWQTQTTLGEALSINPDEPYYYVFRDLASSLEYIRSGQELCEKGLFVELGAYEYHAFIDFREILDDNKGHWKMLCSCLQGRPVLAVIIMPPFSVMWRRPVSFN